jgi:hypothetical protein
MATSKKSSSAAEDATPPEDESIVVVNDDSLPADAWVSAAYEAFDLPPEVVRAALSVNVSDTYNRSDVSQAIVAYLTRPAD